MKQLILTIILLFIISCDKQNNKELDYVLEKFYENSNRIKNVEYFVRRIDTFPQNGVVWDNKGLAYIEKDINDTIFGISFYSKRFDTDKLHIYKNSIGYEFIENRKEFRNEKGAIGFLGKPGGQMVSTDIFKLDTVYSSLKLTTEKNSYVLNYKYENDTINNVTNIIKVLRLRKTDFFPVEIIKKSNVLGKNKFSTHFIFSDVRINKKSNYTIDSLIKEKINIYTNTEENRESLIGKKFSISSLPDLIENKEVKIKENKVTLIDFWETWCGPCVESISKIEKLNKKYSNKIQIIGIVSEDKKNAIKIAKEKGLNFINLFGNKEILKKYKIDSFPRYLLINNSGIIIREYFGFSEDIESDIKTMIIEDDI